MMENTPGIIDSMSALSSTRLTCQVVTNWQPAGVTVSEGIVIDLEVSMRRLKIVVAPGVNGFSTTVGVRLKHVSIKVT